MGKAAVLGALNIGAFFPLLFLAAYRLPGGVAAVVGSVGPLFVVGLAALLLGDRPTVRALVTAVAAAFGVSLVVLKAGAALDLVGVVAGLLSALSMSAGVVLTKRWGRPEGVGASPPPAGSSPRAASSSCRSPSWSRAPRRP